MASEPMNVAGDREAVGADSQLDRSRATVNRKLLPVMFGAGIVGGSLIAIVLVFSAHALIWPEKKTDQPKTGTARTVSQTQAMRDDDAFKALNGGAAPTRLGSNGQPVGPDGQPLTPGQAALLNGQPINTYGTPGQQSQAAGASGAAPQLTSAQKLAVASRTSPIMGFAGGIGSMGGGMPQGQLQAQPQAEGGGIVGPLVGGQGGPQPPGSFVTTPASGGDLNARLATSTIEVARASMIGDRNFLVAAGRTIPCTLQTAINSAQAGIVSCIIGEDVFSENGRVVMLDKGTKVLGQYTGGVRQGQARLFVIWTRALTPRGVVIDLGSPASDQLGRAGIGGGVDTQFWQRFGAALMFSVLEDAASIGSSHFAGIGTNTTQVPATTSAAALQGSQNIQPILKANQGQTVAIQVARDYDFGQVYDVAIRTSRTGR